MRILTKLELNIKVCAKLGHSVMQMFIKFKEVYGSVKEAYETVRRWREKSVTDTKSVRNATKSDRPFTVIGKHMTKIPVI